MLRKASHEPFDFAQGRLKACSRGSIRLRAPRFAQDDGAFLLVLWFEFVSGLKRWPTPLLVSAARPLRLRSGQALGHPARTLRLAQGTLEACSRGSIRLRALRFAQDDGSFLLGLWVESASEVKTSPTHRPFISLLWS